MRLVLLVAALAQATVVACSPTPRPSSPGAAVESPGSPNSPASSPRVGNVPPSRVNAAGGMCGGIAGFACEPGLYCSFPLDAMCGAADQTGTCAPVPEMCTQQFAPVCGCNDKTYPNACYAAREGVSVGRNGECPSQ